MSDCPRCGAETESVYVSQFVTHQRCPNREPVRGLQARVRAWIYGYSDQCPY